MPAEAPSMSRPCYIFGFFILLIFFILDTSWRTLDKSWSSFCVNGNIWIFSFCKYLAIIVYFGFTILNNIGLILVKWRRLLGILKQSNATYLDSFILPILFILFLLKNIVWTFVKFLLLIVILKRNNATTLDIFYLPILGKYCLF